MVNKNLNTFLIGRLKYYDKIKEKSAVFTNEFTLASGAITAHKWVLESEEE